MCRARPLFWPTPGRLGASWIRQRIVFLRHPGPAHQRILGLGKMEVSARALRTRPHMDRGPYGSGFLFSRGALDSGSVRGGLVPPGFPHPGDALVSLDVRRAVLLVPRQEIAAGPRFPPVPTPDDDAASLARLQRA